MIKTINKSSVSLVRGDITRQDVDAIVNAANSSLMGGGGVDGAIHRAGGPSILEECKQIRKLQGTCPPGEAVITGGGKLQAMHVIHTVGPIWHGGKNDEPAILGRAYRNSLTRAVEAGARTVAFPSISTGAYGYPVDKAARVALAEVINFCNEHAEIDEVRFVLFDEKTLSAYEAALEELV
jgi:O-acetyl-ADP-ribose deacetylase (regulator of RNase III)